ncbi:hypothetical protein ACJJTC_005505 [Scirpophaga incertulas]
MEHARPPPELCLEDEEKDRDDVYVLLKKFDEYFGVKTNVTLARYNFFSRSQEEGESINHTVVRDRLLRTDDLTLSKTIKICQIDEISIDSNRMLESRGAMASAATSVDVVEIYGAGRGRGRGRWHAVPRRHRGRGSRWLSLARCGRPRVRRRCPVDIVSNDARALSAVRFGRLQRFSELRGGCSTVFCV